MGEVGSLKISQAQLLTHNIQHAPNRSHGRDTEYRRWKERLDAANEQALAAAKALESAKAAENRQPKEVERSARMALEAATKAVHTASKRREDAEALRDAANKEHIA
ncbi:hypothetical protein ACHAXT_011965 [Thalassiosira profunda]